ncbi:MAG: DUF362 domain-containing protein, partial [Anaerovoracaceae bacterium]
MSWFKVTKNTFGNLFAAKSSGDDLAEISSVFENGKRGSIDIKTDECTLCGECGQECVTGAINVNDSDRVWEINRMQCILCGECTDVCPEGCLFISSSRIEPDFAVLSDIFNIDEESD